MDEIAIWSDACCPEIANPLTCNQSSFILITESGNSMCLKIKNLYLSAELKRDSMDDVNNFNTDVIVLVEEDDENGSRKKNVKYIASFFTYANIFELQSHHIKTGEYLNGKYFYSKNMVLIDNCSIESIQAVVNHLMEEGEFREAFKRL